MHQRGLHSDGQDRPGLSGKRGRKRRQKGENRLPNQREEGEQLKDFGSSIRSIIKGHENKGKDLEGYRNLPQGAKQEEGRLSAGWVQTPNPCRKKQSS